jgi:transcriptional regulator with XRE-family HTH domain
LYEKITALCKSKGVSGSRMCLDLGLSKSTMSDLKFGRIKGISIPTAQKIAGYFGITVDELYGEEAKKEQPIENDGLSEDLKELIDRIKTLPEEKIQLLLQLAKTIE